MSHNQTASEGSRFGLTATAVLCVCLLLPAMAFAYGGGGGDVGGSSSSGGPGMKPMPSGLTFPWEIGPEGQMVEPPPGTWGNYVNKTGKPVNKPGPGDAPQSGNPAYEFIKSVVMDEIKDKLLAIILVSNPQLLMAVKAVDKSYGAIVLTKDAVDKLDKAKKDYMKALAGTMGSAVKAPPMEMPEMNSYNTGGGGPQQDHTFGNW